LRRDFNLADDTDNKEKFRNVIDQKSNKFDKEYSGTVDLKKNINMGSSLVKSCSPPPMQVRFNPHGQAEKRTICGTPEMFTRYINFTAKKSISPVLEKINSRTEKKVRKRGNQICTSSNPKKEEKVSFTTTKRLKRKYIPFTPQALDSVRERYQINNQRGNSCMNRTQQSIMMTTNMFTTLKTERPEAKLMKFPDQLKKWDRVNQYISKQVKRDVGSSVMNRSDDYIVKQQEIKYLTSLQEESTQYGSLRWMAELRGDANGLNSVVTPIGYK